MSSPVSARKDGKNIIYSVGPDVCKTPMGSSMVPVPYVTVVTLQPSPRHGQTVFNNGLPDFTLNSRTIGVTGHEAGIGRGAVKAGYKGYANAMTAGPTVFSEGYAVVRDGDRAWINGPEIQSDIPRRVRRVKKFDHA